MESLTDELERLATAMIEKVDGMGGAVRAIEAGYYQDEIHDAAFRIQQGIESGHRVVVGVNRFVDADEQPLELQRIAEEETARQIARVGELRVSRDQAAVDAGLASVVETAAGTGNLLAGDEGGAARPRHTRRGLGCAPRRVRRVPPLPLVRRRLLARPDRLTAIASAQIAWTTATTPAAASTTAAIAYERPRPRIVQAIATQPRPTPSSMRLVTASIAAEATGDRPPSDENLCRNPAP